jgi:60s Acidic ribosomal protein
VKDMLSNVGSGGGAPVVGSAAPAAGGGGAAAEEAPKEEAKKEEEKEESDDDMVRSLWSEVDVSTHWCFIFLGFRSIRLILSSLYLLSSRVVSTLCMLLRTFKINLKPAPSEGPLKITLNPIYNVPASSHSNGRCHRFCNLYSSQSKRLDCSRASSICALAVNVMLNHDLLGHP